MNAKLKLIQPEPDPPVPKHHPVTWQHERKAPACGEPQRMTRGQVAQWAAMNGVEPRERLGVIPMAAAALVALLLLAALF